MTLATVTLGTVSQEFPALIPTQAFYSFTLDESDPDATPLTILMLTTGKTEGQFNVGENYIPSGSNSSVLISNNVLMSGILLPTVASVLDTSTSNFTVTSGQLSLASNVSATIDGKSIEINTLTMKVEDNTIKFSMDGTHDFFWGIGLEISASASVDFEVSAPDNGQQTIKLVLSDSPEVNVKPTLPWWLQWTAWILKLFGPIVSVFILIAEAIFVAIVNSLCGQASDVAASFAGFALKQVNWKYTDWVELEKIDLPGPVQIGANLAPDAT